MCAIVIKGVVVRIDGLLNKYPMKQKANKEKVATKIVQEETAENDSGLQTMSSIEEAQIEVGFATTETVSN